MLVSIVLEKSDAFAVQRSDYRTEAPHLYAGLRKRVSLRHELRSDQRFRGQVSNNSRCLVERRERVDSMICCG